MKRILIMIILGSLLISGFSYMHKDKITKYNFQEIYIRSNKLILAKSNDKWGKISLKGSYTVEPVYDDVHRYTNNDNLIGVSIGRKYGVISGEGNLIIKAEYDSLPVYIEEARVFIVRKGPKYGLIDYKGKIVVSPSYELLEEGALQTVVYKKDGKYGIINIDGSVVVDAKYDTISRCTKDTFAVELNQSWGLIDTRGAYVVKPKYEFIEAIPKEGDIIPVNYRGSWGYINSRGITIIEPMYDEVDIFSEGLAAAKVDDKWGYIDMQNKTIIEPVYKKAYRFINGMAAVSKESVSNSDGEMKEEQVGLININGDFVLEPKYKEISYDNQLITVYTHERNIGYYSKDLKMYIEPTGFTSMTSFNENGIATVNNLENDTIRFVDLQGKDIFEKKYRWGEILEDFNGGVVGVQVDGKWGYMDMNEKMIIPAKFDIVESFKDGLAVVMLQGRFTIMDSKGNLLF